jgi:hypothetical protein
VIQPAYSSRPWKHRRLFSAVAVLLLLMMQQEANLHAVQHVGEWAKLTQQQGLEVSSASAYCVECALLAGGANLVASAVPGSIMPAHETTPTSATFSTRPAAAPSFYSSRGPPKFL